MSKIGNVLLILIGMAVTSLHFSSKYFVGTSGSQESRLKTSALTDYIPIPLPPLIGQSDLIVTGKIKAIQDSTFVIEVDEYLKSETSSTTLLVRKFTPLPFYEPRIVPYRTSQKLCLFLTKPNDLDQPWGIMGRAAEGERFIENGFVYFDPFYLRGLTKQNYSLYGTKKELQRFSLSDFIDAIRHYQTCFLWSSNEEVLNDQVRKLWKPSRSCSDTVLKQYKEKSWLHTYLVEDTLKRIPEK